MMGERRVMQEALFWPSIDPELMIRMLIIGYCFGVRSVDFSLERHVPDNHLLRKIDRFVDLSRLSATTVSNSLRRRSLSRKRPWRFFEKVE
jgi:hypothetical protein